MRAFARSVDVIRALWAGETVTHRGLVKVEEAKLYTRPKRSPLLIGAAVTEKTAEWVGGWADEMITTSRAPKEAKKMVERVPARRRRGKTDPPEGGAILGETDDEARRLAYQQWRTP